MADEPTARERAEALAVQYAAEECLFAATDAIEAALTAAEQRGREAMWRLCLNEAERPQGFSHSSETDEGAFYFSGDSPRDRRSIATGIRALKDPTDAG